MYKFLTGAMMRSGLLASYLEEPVLFLFEIMKANGDFPPELPPAPNESDLFLFFFVTKFSFLTFNPLCVVCASDK